MFIVAQNLKKSMSCHLEFVWFVGIVEKHDVILFSLRNSLINNHIIECLSHSCQMKHNISRNDNKEGPTNCQQHPRHQQIRKLPWKQIATYFQICPSHCAQTFTVFPNWEYYEVLLSVKCSRLNRSVSKYRLVRTEKPKHSRYSVRPQRMTIILRSRAWNNKDKFA